MTLLGARLVQLQATGVRLKLERAASKREDKSCRDQRDHEQAARESGTRRTTSTFCISEAMQQEPVRTNHVVRQEFHLESEMKCTFVFNRMANYCTVDSIIVVKDRYEPH